MKGHERHTLTRTHTSFVSLREMPNQARQGALPNQVNPHAKSVTETAFRTSHSPD
jgi:hypothetical protein